MIKTAMLGAVMLATAFSSQVRAQAAVDDPGYCAQYYPSANCQNYGPGNPMYRGHYPFPGYVAPVGRPDGYAAMPRRPYRRHHHHG